MANKSRRENQASCGEQVRSDGDETLIPAVKDAAEVGESLGAAALRF